MAKLNEKTGKSKFITAKIMDHFNALGKDFASYDNERENLIKLSREILKLSKLIIYDMQAKDHSKLTELTKEILAKQTEMTALAKKHPELAYEGSYNIAEQELAEALLIKSLVLDKKLLTTEELKIKPDNYLLALCDLTGELLRLAVIDATDKNFDAVSETKTLVNEIYYLLLNLDMREHEFRHKFDQVKYALKKLDEICYDIGKMK